MSAATHNLRTETRESAPFRATVARPAATPRREYRERDFGIGYGNSSGYASNRRYASNWGEPRFRCT
jgi:hypothetical protein